MGSAASLIWGVLFGAIGLGFLVYGKRRKSLVPFCAGAALCVVPYFIPSVLALVVVGVILIAAPFLVRIDL